MASTAGSRAACPQKLDHRLEGIEGMVQQDVLVADHREDVFVFAGRRQRRRHGGNERRVLQSGRSNW